MSGYIELWELRSANAWGEYCCSTSWINGQPPHAGEYGTYLLERKDICERYTLTANTADVVGRAKLVIQDLDRQIKAPEYSPQYKKLLAFEKGYFERFTQFVEEGRVLDHT